MYNRFFLFFSILLFTVKLVSQDAREFNHGVCFVPFQTVEDETEYYLTWSSSFDNSWEHDVYKSIVFFNEIGDLIIESESQVYIGSGSDEAQEPVNLGINSTNNYILSVWEDGNNFDAPNVKGQLHKPDGSIITENWTIAGGEGAQHSAYTVHLENAYLIFYADEAYPSIGGAVVKAKIIDDLSGVETQTISFTPNTEDHWWPVAVSNTSNTKSLVVWGNDGYSVRGTVLENNTGIIEETQSPQDYLINTQQYYYQVEWLEYISRFLLVARNGAFDTMTNESQVCLIDSEGNITNTTIVNGGIKREAKMAVKWNESNQTYFVFFPSGSNNLTQFSVNDFGDISDSTQIINHPDLELVEWPSTGIWSSFIVDQNGNDLFENHYIAFFVMNDLTSNDSVKIPVHLDLSLFSLLADDTIEDFMLYPNPTKRFVNIPTVFSGSNFLLYSIEGRLVSSGTIQSNRLDLEALKKGIYFIQLINRDKKRHQIFKIVKEK